MTHIQILFGRCTSHACYVGNSFFMRRQKLQKQSGMNWIEPFPHSEESSVLLLPPSSLSSWTDRETGERNICMEAYDKHTHSHSTQRIFHRKSSVFQLGCGVWSFRQATPEESGHLTGLGGLRRTDCVSHPAATNATEWPHICSEWNVKRQHCGAGHCQDS